MKNEIGWSAPQESILIPEDLGARFYVCSPWIFGHGVREQDLIAGKYTLGAVVTWAGLLARLPRRPSQNRLRQRPELLAC